MGFILIPKNVCFVEFFSPVMATRLYIVDEVGGSSFHEHIR